MLARDLVLIAMALDTYVKEYSGAAPEEEIEKAEELAEYFWIKADKAKERSLKRRMK